MSFSKDLLLFQKRTMQKYVQVKRMSALDLFSAIVLETPVLKGVLRNNWFAEIGTASSQMTSSADASGMGTINRIKNVLNGVNLDKDVFFSNSLPYAYPIEFDGHSGKAPLGMVRVNTSRWEKIVENNVRKVNSGF